MEPIPINVAESIIEVFWDPQLRSFADWQYKPNTGGNVSVNEGWCFLQFSWEKLAENENVFTMSRGLLALRYYAKARGMSLKAVVPKIILNTGKFADAIMSTEVSQDHIPICDAHATGAALSLALLSHLVPDSSWTKMLKRNIARSGESSSWRRDPLAEVCGTKESSGETIAPSFLYLPEMRLASSTRKLGEQTVKLVVRGNRAGAGHTHEDTGSFILELDGKTFARDPGIRRYDNPMTIVLKTCQRHNMLVPIGTDERAHPENPIDRSVEIEAEGDNRLGLYKDPDNRTHGHNHSRRGAAPRRIHRKPKTNQHCPKRANG